jgi:hypothetical protein
LPVIFLQHSNARREASASVKAASKVAGVGDLRDVADRERRAQVREQIAPSSE